MKEIFENGDIYYKLSKKELNEIKEKSKIEGQNAILLSVSKFLETMSKFDK